MDNILDAENWEENEKRFAEEFSRWEIAQANRPIISERDWEEDNPRPENKNMPKFFNCSRSHGRSSKC